MLSPSPPFTAAHPRACANQRGREPARARDPREREPARARARAGANPRGREPAERAASLAASQQSKSSNNRSKPGSELAVCFMQRLLCLSCLLFLPRVLAFLVVACLAGLLCWLSVLRCVARLLCLPVPFAPFARLAGSQRC